MSRGAKAKAAVAEAPREEIPVAVAESDLASAVQELGVAEAIERREPTAFHLDSAEVSALVTLRRYAKHVMTLRQSPAWGKLSVHQKAAMRGIGAVCLQMIGASAQEAAVAGLFPSVREELGMINAQLLGPLGDSTRMQNARRRGLDPGAALDNALARASQPLDAPAN